MSFEFVLLDLDNTILDFSKAEAIAVSKTFRDIGLEPTDELVRSYVHFNNVCWQAMERGELPHKDVYARRFEMLFDSIGFAGDADAAQEEYENLLCIGHYFIPGAPELLEELYGKYRLFLVSNGSAKVQASRLKSSGISRYFESIFISEKIGFDKPDIRYFDYCFSHIPGFDRSRAIIVGDSLTSDIRGGKNCGIATCHFTKPGADSTADYVIYSLDELPYILEKGPESK